MQEINKSFDRVKNKKESVTELVSEHACDSRSDRVEPGSILEGRQTLEYRTSDPETREFFLRGNKNKPKGRASGREETRARRELRGVLWSRKNRENS